MPVLTMRHDFRVPAFGPAPASEICAAALEQLAVLDLASGGRVRTVAGAGYRREEFEMAGIELGARGGRGGADRGGAARRNRIGRVPSMLSDRRQRWCCAALIALIVLPLLVSAVQLVFGVGSDYYPTADWAVFELRARDVWHHEVLVGPYSRFGWNHPGPLLFYVLAVPYRLLGSSSISMHLTALFVNAATIVAIGVVAFRRGRLPTAIAVLLPVAVLVHALGVEEMRDPWNPYLPILPLLLLVLLVWSIALDDLWMAPFAVIVAGFATQSHVGFAGEVLALLCVAAIAVLLRAVRCRAGERRARWQRILKVTLVSLTVGLLLWAPVLYGTLVRRDDNLSHVVDFLRNGSPRAGWQLALEVMGLQWGPRPEWIFGARGSSLFGIVKTEPHWWLAVGLGFAVGATVIAARRRAWDVVWLAVVIGAGLIAATLTVSNIVDLVIPYIVRWTWVLGAAIGMLVLTAAWVAVPERRRARVLRVAAPVALTAVGALAVAASVNAANAGTPFARQQPKERILAREVLAALQPGRGPVLVDATHGGWAVPGIVLQLERHGMPVEVTPEQSIVFGPDRRPAGAQYRARLMVVSGYDEIGRLTPPGPRIAHYVRPLTAVERRVAHKKLYDMRLLPPGPARTALTRVLRRNLNGPAEEIAVYLASPS